MKGYEAIARALLDCGSETVFGLLGDANLFVMHAFTQNGGCYIGAVHEASAVCMADGFARQTGNVGVATVTHGPGLTNAVTALTEAARCRTPLLLLVGDTPPNVRFHLQDIDQQAVVQPTGAAFIQVETISTIGSVLSGAFQQARRERRPVVLNVPVDLEWEEVRYEPVEVPEAEGSRELDLSAMDRALGIMASAARPLILVGRGVAADARPSVLELSDLLDAPVATSLLAKGAFDGKPGSIGVFGTLATDEALTTIAAADVIVALGASLNRWTTADGTLLAGKAVVQVDTDPSAFGRFCEIDVPVLGDIDAFARITVESLAEAEYRSSGFRSRIVPHKRVRSTEYGLPAVADLLTSSMAPNTSLVCGAGRFSVPLLQRLVLPEGGRCTHTMHFGTIGLATANAIGAAVAKPEVTTVAVVGDGGFMLGGFTELVTAVRAGVPLVLVVINDGSYGAEYIQLVRAGLDPGLALLEWPDLAAGARALGANAHTVRDLPELESMGSVISGHPAGPVVIDIHLDPASVG